MGILLPPVSQVSTVSSTHLTLHHRNRSLDSALQRIPEVDITPSPECEATAAASLPSEPQKASKKEREELVSLGSDDSGILCGSDSGSSETNTTRESSVEHLTTATQSRESLHTSVVDKQFVKGVMQSDSSDGETNLEITDNVNQNESEIIINDTTQTDLVILKDLDKCNTNVPLPETPDAKPSKDLLLRLLESKMFDVTMAIPYLFQSKEHGVQSYIANKMFSYPDHDVDFYLPQLVCMYIQMHDVAEAIHPYLVHRYVVS